MALLSDKSWESVHRCHEKIRDVMEKMEESYIQALTELSVSQDIKVFLEDAGNISSEKYVNAVKKELYIYKK